MKTKKIVDPIVIDAIVENKSNNDNKNRSKKQVKKSVTRTRLDNPSQKESKSNLGIPNSEVIATKQLPIVTDTIKTKLTWYTKVSNWFKKLLK